MNEYSMACQKGVNFNVWVQNYMIFVLTCKGCVIIVISVHTLFLYSVEICLVLPIDCKFIFSARKTYDKQLPQQVQLNEACKSRLCSRLLFNL